MRTIPAAEAWAIWLVFHSTLAVSVIYTDCRSCLTIAERGRSWATSANRTNARVWCAIYGAVDSEGALCRALTWIPAHTTQEQIGTLMNSDGLAVTSVEWLANFVVDLLAKRAANSHAVPPACLRAMSDAATAVAERAAVLGLITYASQNHKSHTTDAHGKECVTTVRDSTGKPAVRRQARKTEKDTVDKAPPPAKCCKAPSEPLTLVAQRNRVASALLSAADNFARGPPARRRDALPRIARRTTTPGPVPTKAHAAPATFPAPSTAPARPMPVDMRLHGDVYARRIAYRRSKEAAPPRMPQEEVEWKVRRTHTRSNQPVSDYCKYNHKLDHKVIPTE